ncbi:hypothetical protein AB6G29_23875 [Providencia hangzhouensis]|uniref:hypothetical protein n=1 Tax=Providencia hangzhouensis TaxID=3031799 RepID=UPI0034DD5EFB
MANVLFLKNIPYLGCSPYSYSNRIESVWGLVDRIDIPFHLRAILAMTFDNCYIKKEHYGIAAECLQKYLVDFPPEPNTVNHWTRIYEVLSLYSIYPAIGFWMTSVAENPFQGDWNEEETTTINRLGRSFGVYSMNLNRR